MYSARPWCVTGKPRYGASSSVVLSEAPALEERSDEGKDLYVTLCQVQVLRFAQDDNTRIKDEGLT